MGFASSYWDIRGVNGNRCEGRVSGLNAVIQGIQALKEHRADIVVAGGADRLIRFQPHTSHQLGETAAFVVMRRSPNGFSIETGCVFRPDAPQRLEVGTTPDVGAATGLVEWIRSFDEQKSWGEVRVYGEDGTVSWLRPFNGA